MASPKVLFSLPIDSPAGGKIEASEIKPRIYLFAFTHAPDNRLTTPFCNTFLLALNMLEFGGYERGAVIVTSGIAKFFSNGFDLNHVSQTPGFWDKIYFPMLKRLLVFPWPTVALINGHAFGAGVFHAVACDYRVMNPAKGFLCLPEIDFGAIIPGPIQVMFRQKVTDPAVFRTMVQEGARVPGKQALEFGVVDALGGMDEALQLIASRKLLDKTGGGEWGSGAWGQLKENTFAETLAALDDWEGVVAWRSKIEQKKDEDKAVAMKAIQKFKSSSKL